MIVNADRQGPAITTNTDDRITAIGKFLRQTKLDELPQLFNVWRGEMSLVGPRPEAPYYVGLYDDRMRQILQFQPGITSAASLKYRHESQLLAGENWETVYIDRIMPEKIAIDLHYCQRANLFTDLHLILRTAIAVLR
jgi:lipopolysaccharide/colanic/teichoic acid biosynthesis glycosyltransferase